MKITIKKLICLSVGTLLLQSGNVFADEFMTDDQVTCFAQYLPQYQDDATKELGGSVSNVPTKRLKTMSPMNKSTITNQSYNNNQTASDRYVKYGAYAWGYTDTKKTLSVIIWDYDSQVMLAKISDADFNYNNQISLIARLPEKTIKQMKRDGFKDNPSWINIYCTLKDRSKSE